MDRLSDQRLANAPIFSEVSSSPDCGNDDSTHGYTDTKFSIYYTIAYNNRCIFKTLIKIT